MRASPNDFVLVMRWFFPPQEETSPFHTRQELAQQRLMINADCSDPEKCWEWKFSLEGGYGRTSFLGEKIMAHRLSWEAFKGEIPNGLFVLHRCDNRKCINPSHLFLGTLAENNLDRDAKGRHKPRYGTDNGLAKLNYEKARKIRVAYECGAGQRELAEAYGVSQKAIFMVIHNITWKEENFTKIEKNSNAPTCLAPE